MVSGPSPLTRLRWRRRFRSLVALLLLGGLAYAAWVWLPAPVTTVPLVHVIDGDSLTVQHEDATLTIRLTGIDAVEYRQDCARGDASRWPCGREARTMLEKLAGRGPLYCEVAAKDHYDRTLAACRTRPFPDGIDLGAELVGGAARLGGSDQRRLHGRRSRGAGETARHLAGRLRPSRKLARDARASGHRADAARRVTTHPLCLAAVSG